MTDTAPVVVHLVPKAATSSADVMAALEGMLEHARSGELAGVAIAGVYRDGGTGSAYEVGGDISKLVGSVEYLKYRLLKHMAGD